MREQPTNPIASAVRLGFEVGSGDPVDIPVRHMVVTGQTQEAGKTTTLEALIHRARARALCFVTKRGEGSFGEARRVAPYFREQADWQFVASILEASRGEKLKIERAWIIRASKGAHTLAQVQQNVRAAMLTAKGMSADMYLVLDAYLSVVVPQIAAVDWATRVVLESGVNAMDMTELAMEMQHLVLRSSISWVLERESGTIVVVPEAWKFIPQGRGTPVKLAAEAYIRQGAGLKNFLWLDSQDIAGVDKTILKSVPVWVLGVQRESNEIKRTLAQIPGGIKKPKPEQVATLKLGEFFACWGSDIVRVYVQPKWMDDETAKAIARGTMAVDRVVPPASPAKGKPMDADRMERLEEMMETMTRNVAGLASVVQRDMPSRAATPAPQPQPARAPETMTATEAGEEGMYQRFKARLVKEAPAIVALLVQEPEINITVERKTVEVDHTTAKGMIVSLIKEGFFDAGATAYAAWKELKRRWNYGGISARASEQCDGLVVMGFLTKEESEGRAQVYKTVPAAKRRIKES